jgi:translation elongation factor EF-4
MITITDIRDQLIEMFNGLRDGSVQAKDAIEINNTAGKIINTAKVQIAYSALRGEAPNIPFLDTGNAKKIKTAAKPEGLK